ncbi:hypothetical protein CCUS01_11471, partial [Colletotrichum cuscutae]
NVILLKLKADSLILIGIYKSTYTIHNILSTASDTTLRSKVVNIYIYSLRGVYRLYISISGLAFLISFLIKRVLLIRSLRSGHTIHAQAKGYGSIHGSRS